MKISKRLILLLCLSISVAAVLGGIEVFFSPQDRPAKKLIAQIDKASKRILAAVYMLTDKKIAQALINAHNRGLDVRLVLDKSSFESPWGKTVQLSQAGVKVFLLKQQLSKTCPSENEEQDGEASQAEIEADDTPAKNVAAAKMATNLKPKTSSCPLMHNKFVIIDEQLWTGSFNWTVSANNKNFENAMLIKNEPATMEQYLQNFEHLIAQAQQITPEQAQQFKRELVPHKKAELPPSSEAEKVLPESAVIIKATPNSTTAAAA